MQLKKFIGFAVIFVAALAALFGWALFWPEDACGEPACVRPRFSLAVEVDAFRQVAPIDFEVPVGEGSISLHQILAAGGIDVRVQPGQMDLPYMAASGPLDRADLYQFAATWRSKTRPEDVDARIYALLATALISDTGESLFGIMFDDVDREGFAVAPAMTVSKFGEREPEAIPLLQLRTFTHELLHALNRRHLDAAVMHDGRLSVEAPTRCISGQEYGHWYLREFPLLAISPETIRFFQTASPRDVLPGQESARFQKHSSPTECEDARANLAGEMAVTRWQLAQRRLRRAFSIQTARATDEWPADADTGSVAPKSGLQQSHAQGASHDGADEGEDPGDNGTEVAAPETPPVELQVQALPTPYPLGYPIAIRILARNDGDRPLPIKGRLMPGYGMVHVEYRPLPASDHDDQMLDDRIPTAENLDGDAPHEGEPDAPRWKVQESIHMDEHANAGAGADAPDPGSSVTEPAQAGWRSVKPLAWFEPASDEQAMLEPGTLTEQTVPIYFGNDGWTFRTPGQYQVRVKMHAARGIADMASDPIVLSVQAPGTPDDQAALQPLLDEQGELDDEVGRLLTFGGRIGVDQDIAPLESAARRYGHTALGSALRLTLISQRLRRPIDPLTGLRPLPDFSDAREMLKDTCTDSGIAALKHQMLLGHADAIPQGMSDQAHTGTAAWDGISTSRGESIPTYSDTGLESWGPRIQFCFDEAELHGPSRRQALRAARQLRRSRPERVVVVGHGDFAGSCRYNDSLGLRRAAALRQMLIDQGVPRHLIHIASLGERRPLDFSSTRAAHDRNRRVEILVTRGTPSAGARLSRTIASNCPAQPPFMQADSATGGAAIESPAIDGSEGAQ